MEKKLQRSVVPIYLFGISWVAYAIVFPLYKGVHFICAFAVAMAVYLLARKIIPAKEVMVEKELKGKTGNEKVDNFIEEVNGYIKQMRGFESSIKNESIKTKTDEIEQITIKITDYIAQNPDALPDVRRFASYYLPTTIKLLQTYSELEAQEATTPNIAGTMTKIDNMLDTVIEAFNKQYDSLYEYHAMDIGAEINVMENILTSEGLIDKKNDISQSDKSTAVEDFEDAAGKIELTLEPDTQKEKI